MALVIKKSFDQAVAQKQEGIANYLSERLDAHAKMAWMLRATLQ
jgi:DNA-binding ferritin-like protein